MLFDFTDEQREFARSVDAWVAREFGADTLRQAWQDGHARSRSNWDKLAELGLTTILAPEELGGLGGRFSDLTLSLERVGAAGLDEPVAATGAVVLPTLLRFGASELRETYAEQIAEGSLMCTIALGDSDLVADGGRADIVLYESEGALRLARSGEFAATPVDSQDPSRRLARCMFDDSRSEIVTDDATALRWVRAVSATVTATLLNGLSTTLLDMSTEYVKQRQQFGQAVGSFQAIKHKLADVMIALEAARSVGWFAMYELDSSSEGWAASSAMAKSMATRANLAAANAALQCHGGIGFTREHNLHLFLQRSMAWRAIDGSVAQHRRTTARGAIEELRRAAPVGIGA
ncbi:acyl-CoA dehydrogenase family protein [Rhodococcus sp. IEGM 1307]|uniref:acyl-CoA dehydrogenase family protein n=1 Tax=Rhodococcus sp. IEGM 1307 TaxID=3047091 RepID=UPI0024B87551|nr:acyl-CoA dehydrogenase family protein [Rhodococcus sp. IEGM 1307]MDI9979410.1 acyl-CoA dehydrogenase family protein [Rhodococcus sp. IEGM 1307]